MAEEIGRVILSVIHCCITKHSKTQWLKTVCVSQLYGLGIQGGLQGLTVQGCARALLLMALVLTHSLGPWFSSPWCLSLFPGLPE